MLAALDETAPEFPHGVAYVVAAAVIMADEASARSEIAKVLCEPGRIRPFHWHQEGPTARTRMMGCLEEIGAVAHICVHYPTARKRMESARAVALAELVPRLVADGTSQLLIEGRGRIEDARDRAVVLSALNDLGTPGAFTYEWRSKAEPLLWTADAVCGTVRQHLIDPANAPHFDRLRSTGVIGNLVYLASP